MALEKIARYSIACGIGNIDIPEPPPLYSLKAGGNSDSTQKRDKRVKDYKDALKRRDEWLGHVSELLAYIPTKRYGLQRPAKRAAVSFFARGECGKAFVAEVYGTSANAYYTTNTHKELTDEFMRWFERKRKEMRMEMTTQLAVNTTTKSTELSKTVVGRPRSPLPHGGVANLLKVLTKTMEQQGSDIRSIAKVQYQICKEAGITIPDEFIEDVAIALYAEGAL